MQGSFIILADNLPFDFTMRFKVSIQSRDFNVTNSAVHIRSYAQIVEMLVSDSGKYNISLYQKRPWWQGGDVLRGTATYDELFTQTWAWSGLPQGVYYFVAWRGNDGLTLDGNGRVW